MTLSNETVTSFQKLYLEKYGILLGYNDAQDIALSMLTQFALIYRPMRADDAKTNRLHGTLRDDKMATNPA